MKNNAPPYHHHRSLDRATAGGGGLMSEAPLYWNALKGLVPEMGEILEGWVSSGKEAERVSLTESVLDFFSHVNSRSNSSTYVPRHECGAFNGSLTNLCWSQSAQ